MSLTKEKFLEDVANHKLLILREDGVYRHLRFQKPGTSCMHFDLITWPGYLCYTGDMGTFVFQRLHDMLAFFRPSECDAEDPFKWIDRRYWHEKLEGADRGEGAKEFDPDAFRREITSQRRRLLVRHGRDMTQEQREELWEELGQLKDKAEDGEECAMFAAYDWSHRVWERGEVKQRIWMDTDDFPDCKTWTHRFEWCCFALRWGVMMYDQTKAASQEQAPAPSQEGAA